MTYISIRRFLFSLAAIVAFQISATAQTNGYTRPPLASNTIAAIAIGDMRFSPADYSILNSITETATICVEHTKRGYTITCEDENFMLKYKYWDKAGDSGAYLDDWDGVIKLGFLTVDVNESQSNGTLYPDDIARGLALYRLIGTIQQMGADAVLAPVVSMNMAKSGRLYYYKVTATGRPIKIKTH